MDFLNILIVLWLSANPSLHFVAAVVSPMRSSYFMLEAKPCIWIGFY